MLFAFICHWPNVSTLKWHTYFLFLSADNFHDNTAVLTRPVGKQMNEVKSATQENEQIPFRDQNSA